MCRLSQELEGFDKREDGVNRIDGVKGVCPNFVCLLGKMLYRDGSVSIEEMLKDSAQRAGDGVGIGVMENL